MAKAKTTVEYLTTTRIGEKGQVTVPKQFREDLGVAAGAPFAVLRLGDGLILFPEQQRFERLCREVSARLTEAGSDTNEFLSTLPAARTEVYEQRYGKRREAQGGRRRVRSRR